MHGHHEAVAVCSLAARSCPARCPSNGAVALWVSVPGATAFPLLEGCRVSQWRKRGTAIARHHDVSARWRIATSGQLARPGRHCQLRGHVSPPVAALGGNGTSPLDTVRCSVGSVSGHGGVPPCPSCTKLSRGARGSCGARPLRQSYITPHCPQCPPVSRKLLLWQPPLHALRVKATGVMQNCLCWVRSHSSRRSTVASAPYAPPAGSLVAVVASWHWPGASRWVLVSGLRPVRVCEPRPPWASPLRGIGPALGARPPPGGSLSPAQNSSGCSKKNTAGASRLRC